MQKSETSSLVLKNMWETWERVLALGYLAATSHIGEQTNERTVHVMYRDHENDVSFVIMKGEEIDLHTSVLTGHNWHTSCKVPHHCRNS